MKVQVDEFAVKLKLDENLWFVFVWDGIDVFRQYLRSRKSSVFDIIDGSGQ